MKKVEVAIASGDANAAREALRAAQPELQTRCFPRRFAQEHSFPKDLAAGLPGKGACRLTPRGEIGAHN